MNVTGIADFLKELGLTPERIRKILEPLKEIPAKDPRSSRPGRNISRKLAETYKDLPILK